MASSKRNKLTKKQFRDFYQKNLELLEIEIEQVKLTAQKAIGKNMEEHSIRSQDEVLAATRLYTFLICSWLETRLMKILHEESSVAFTDSEITTIKKKKEMKDKWKECFKLSFEKAIKTTDANGNEIWNYPDPVLTLSNKNEIDKFFVDLDKAITIRNRLAHGQWRAQLNSNSDKVANYPFMNDYDNIQKLESLMNAFKDIANIISMYVTYKDKVKPEFDSTVKQLIDKTKFEFKRIKTLKFDKYEKKMHKSYKKERDDKKKANS